MAKIKNSILKRIKKYSLVTSGIIALANTANAQIVHTDIEPDFTGLVTDWESYSLDIDNDGVRDFDIYASHFSVTSSHSYSSRYLKVNGQLNEILCETFNNIGDPKAIDLSANISNSLNSFSNNADWEGGNQTMAWTWNDFSGGDFRGETDKYLGVRFKIEGEWHYGWVRIDVDYDVNTFVIKEYAYESTPNTPINAGEIDPTALPATNLTGTDINNNGNGSDLQVSFTQATDETTLSEYRIMVVKATQADGFNLTMANSVSVENYQAYAPVGNDYSLPLSETAKDTDGDIIEENIAYKIFVLSIADGTNAVTNILSNPSDEITLEAVGNEPSSPATNLTATDNGNNHNGSDLQVAFTKATEEDKVEEYHIMVVPATVSDFDLEAANLVSSENYTAVAKTGDDIITTLETTANDTEGNLIIENFAYNIYILSKADGTNATINVLSNPSNEITLESVGNEPSSPATNLIATDIGDNHNGSDVQVAFTKATEENKVEEYHIMVVPATVSDFDLEAANLVSSENYTAVAKTGDDIITTLETTANDTEGNLIIENFAYNIYILSKADGTNASINTLSESSNSIVLESTNSIAEIENSFIISSENNNIIIENKNTDGSYKAEIIDLTGRTVNITPLNSNKTIINVEKNKIFIVKIFNNKNKFTKKLYIK